MTATDSARARSTAADHRGTVLGVLIALGAGVGLLFGVVWGQLVLGLLGGAAAGVVVGSILEHVGTK